jgi:hypothetical protein
MHISSSYNLTRHSIDQKKGHYESFFQRANHPVEPLAFWIRYTIFNPNNHPEDAIGELWAIYFDGRTNKHVSVKSEFPMSNCQFSKSSLEAQIGESILNDKSLKGLAFSGQDHIKWDLTFSGKETPLLLLPSKYYNISFPKAKALVGLPLASYTGHLTVNEEEIAIDNWVGSQNHNWGSQHTDRYAWGQVAGFDNNLDSFLEIATAQIKLGMIYSPKMTIAVLRHNGIEYLFNSLGKSIMNKATYRYFEWDFELSNGSERLSGKIRADKQNVVGLNYYNPPGGNKTCLNTKIASADVKLTTKDNESIILTTNNRAAFEILTNDTSHGIKVGDT